jgi:hypothetical protein
MDDRHEDGKQKLRVVEALLFTIVAIAKSQLGYRSQK